MPDRPRLTPVILALLPFAGGACATTLFGEEAVARSDGDGPAGDAGGEPSVDAGGGHPGDGGLPAPEIDAGAIADAAPGAPDAEPSIAEPDAGPSQPPGCTVIDDFGALGSRNGPAIFENLGGGETVRAIFIGLGGAPADELVVALYNGYGAFEDGVTTGTFPLTGEDADPMLCGACVYLDGDLVGDVPAQRFIARGGTLTLTSVNGVLSGSVSDAALVEFDDETGDLVPDGCATRVDSLAFSGTIEAI